MDERVEEIKKRWSQPTGITHYEDCWRYHPSCAIHFLAARLESAEKEVANAWDRAIAIADKARPFGKHKCADPENAKICIACCYTEGLKAALKAEKDKQLKSAFPRSEVPAALTSKEAGDDAY